MAKLERRYSKHELATLLECIKPYERWTKDELKSWRREPVGFRHFAASNITPIELYRPKPRPKFDPPAHNGRKPAA